MRNVLLINQDSGYLMVDIANSLSSEGADVTLLTGRLVLRNKPLENNVRLDKIHKYNRSNSLLRLLSWVIGLIQIIFKIKYRYRHHHLLLVSNPPLTIFVPLFCRNKFSLFFFDLYPEVFVASGVLKPDSFVITSWRKLAKRVIKQAENIFALSEGMAVRLSEYAEIKKPVIIKLWSDRESFDPVPEQKNTFALENNLGGKFVILYSGNLGKTHNIAIIPELASRINDPDILFLIIGNGDQENNLRQKINELNLRNCLLLPFQKVETLLQTFSVARIGLVTQNQGISALSVPSKTFNYLSAGLPLLCVSDGESELVRLVSKYNCGQCFRKDNLDEIAAFIRQIKSEGSLWKKYNNNSILAARDFTSQNASIIKDFILNTIN